MKLKVLTAAMITAFTLAGCGGGSSDPATKEVIDIDKVKMVLETNSDIAHAAYSDSVETAEALKAAIAAFKTDPTQQNLDAAKLAWLVSREPYGQTEVYRFRLSPIDSTNYTDEDGPEGDINAWPLGEALIDYVTTGTDFGAGQIGVTVHQTGVVDPIPTNNIINSTGITIDAALIANTATANDERDVISGYHAIEFLLWGQDLNTDGSADTETTREETTPGNILNSGGHRPLTDFTTDQYAARRHTYLEVAAQKLVDDLKGVRDGWAVGATYRTAFTTVADEAAAKQKLTEMMTGMGTLSEGELAGERMQIAFASNSQEDEHSCFSDNTHRDIWLNAESVANSYYGKYDGYDSTLDGVDNNTARAVTGGYGLDDYLADVDLATEASNFVTALTQTKTDYEEIDNKARNGQPVDNLILDVNRNSSNPMYKTILSLNQQSVQIQNVADALGLGDVVDDDGTGCDTTNPDIQCPE